MIETASASNPDFTYVVSPLPDDRKGCSITVNPLHADSLHKFLSERGLHLTEPRESIHAGSKDSLEQDSVPFLLFDAEEGVSEVENLCQEWDQNRPR